MAPLLALVAIVGVPVLVARNPAWLRRWLLAMLAVTSMGVFATVPDTEHVTIVMLLLVVAALVTYRLGAELPAIGAAAIAVVMVFAALRDSAGESAPIVRAIGCFASLLAVPVAFAITKDRDGGRPSLAAVLVSHVLVAVFASRALIRSESGALVTFVIGVVLAAHIAVLVATSQK